MLYPTELRAHMGTPRRSLILPRYTARVVGNTETVTRPDARYVLIGATGQLAFDLARTFDLPGTLLTPPRSGLDILDARRMGETLRALRPTHVLNTAAWNAVDAAEDEPRRAFALNAEAVGTLAEACQALGATLVHFSTDYVFDGAKGAPYTEDDAPNPLGAVSSDEYGARAKRPPYSVLAHRRLGALGIAEPRAWGVALAAYLAERRALNAPARPGS